MKGEKFKQKIGWIYEPDAFIPEYGESYILTRPDSEVMFKAIYIGYSNGTHKFISEESREFVYDMRECKVEGDNIVLENKVDGDNIVLEDDQLKKLNEKESGLVKKLLNKLKEQKQESVAT